MSFSLVLNSSNVVAGSNNNTYRYNFIQGSSNLKDDSEISVSPVIIPYSFYNISAAYNNNSFILNYPELSVYSSLPINIPD